MSKINISSRTPKQEVELTRSEAAQKRVADNGGGRAYKHHDRVARVTDSDTSIRSLRRLTAGLVASVALIGAGSVVSGGDEAQEKPPVVTTTVGADRDGVWGAVETELVASGYSREDGTITDELVRDLHDDAVELNVAENPGFDSTDLPAGYPIIVIDVGNRPK